MSENGNWLYVVATPLGNLADISFRAVEVLGSVDLIAAEDTRHSARLLSHYGISTPMQSLHDHNEDQRIAGLINRLQSGQSVALISDAGTPLISDPGYRLVVAALDAGIRVVPVPGASAVIAAMSVCGLATDRFVFEGFLPARGAGRRDKLKALADEVRTMVFYESCHRIVESVADMQAILGGDRTAVVARELTKTYETVYRNDLNGVANWLIAEANHRKGEFVLLVEGSKAVAGQFENAEVKRILTILLAELPVKQAAAMAAEITGRKKNELYSIALNLKQGLS